MREIAIVLGSWPLVTHRAYPVDMGLGLLLSLSLPGVVLLLVAVAVVEQVAARRGTRSPLTRRARHALSAGGMDVFSAALMPGREIDLDEQRSRQLIADDVEQGGPPRGRIDLGRGIAYL